MAGAGAFHPAVFTCNEFAEYLAEFTGLGAEVLQRCDSGLGTAL